jgi:hypothetical protein
MAPERLDSFTCLISGVNLDNTDISLTASPRNIAIATGLALLLSAIVLITVILPAEFGIDPLGTGEAMGLTALSGSNEGPLERQPDAHRNDYAEFILEPFQSVEYKYLMDVDTSMIFTWDADADLYYDFHAEPAGLGEEYTVSYDIGTAKRDMGSFHAPFSGIHGWFWENRGFQPVTIRLHSAGFYISSTVFQDGGTYEREFTPVAQ